MFDLDQEIREYLGSLKNKRLMHVEYLDEMESHIRDEVEDLMETGMSEREAFRASIDRLGPSGELLQEYRKINGEKKLAQLANILSYYIDGRFLMKLVIGGSLGVTFMLAGLLLEGGQVSSPVSYTHLTLPTINWV